jgi:quercetin dioxygenase-like cupin family protein
MKLVPSIPDFVRSLPEVEVPLPGVRGWMIQGGAQQVVFLDFAETVEVPEHSHSEQWEFVVAGHVDLRMEGRTLEHRAGENFYIPAGVPHAATVHAGYQALIVFNEAGRYRVKA